MIERLVLSAALTVAFYLALEERGEELSPARTAGRVALLAVLAWASLGWTRSVRLFPDAFPLELPAYDALWLQLGGALAGAAAFGFARGRRGAALGAAFGLIASATGFCASRWPQLARGIELAGGVFVGLAVSTLLTTALAASHAAVAWALAREEWRAHARAVVVGVVAAWAVLTFGSEALLSSVWGYGPRSLPEAAGVPSNAAAPRMAVAWLFPAGTKPWRVDPLRMSSETTDLSRDSIDRLEGYLERTRFRGVFTEEALAAVRLGRLQWMDEEKALDALMLSVPGRVHPDYRRALELLRAGPITAERFGKLEQLSAATGRRVEGFEKAAESQLIFEGFSAAYARFGDETKAREWLARLDGLWAVSEKKIEAGSLEDLREGRVDGSVLVDERPATELRVGLFLVWKSSATGITHHWLSGSREPDADGRFSFDGLGPGKYCLALLGRPADFSGWVYRSPGVFEVTYERPEVLLDPVRVTHFPGATRFSPPEERAPPMPARARPDALRAPPR